MLSKKKARDLRDSTRRAFLNLNVLAKTNHHAAQAGTLESIFIDQDSLNEKRPSSSTDAEPTRPLGGGG